MRSCKFLAINVMELLKNKTILKSTQSMILSPKFIAIIVTTLE